MKRSSKLMLFGLGLFLLAVAIVPPQSQSSSGGPTVIVGNTPLPVQGAVGINNLPAVQSVSGTVSVGNTPSVNVANTPTVNLANGSSMNVSNPLDSQSNPAPLVTLEAAQPYEDLCANNISNGSYEGQCALQTIPAGKRLVIQEVDSSAWLNPGLKLVSLQIETNPSVWHDFTATFMGTFALTGLDFYSSHQQTRLYVGQNQTPTCGVTMGTYVTGASDVFRCAISGFLVDTQ